MLEELRKSLMRELDYRRKAHNWWPFGEQPQRFPHLIVPAPIRGLQYVASADNGIRPGIKNHGDESLARMEFGWRDAGRITFSALISINSGRKGFFTPIRIGECLTPDHRSHWLDLGKWSGESCQRLQEDLLQLLLAIRKVTGDASQIAIKSASPAASSINSEFSRRISEIVGQQKTATVEQIQVGRLVLEVPDARPNLRFASARTKQCLAKTLLNLDQVRANARAAVRSECVYSPQCGRDLRQRVVKLFRPEIYSVESSSKRLASTIAGALNRFFRMRWSIMNSRSQSMPLTRKTLIVGFQRSRTGSQLANHLQP